MAKMHKLEKWSQQFWEAVEATEEDAQKILNSSMTEKKRISKLRDCMRKCAEELGCLEGNILELENLDIHELDNVALSARDVLHKELQEKFKQGEKIEAKHVFNVTGQKDYDKW